MGWKFDTYGREEKCLQFSVRKGDSLEDLEIRKRVIRNWFLKKVGSGCGPESSGWE